MLHARVLAARERHGTHNTYYLHHGRCEFHLTNNPEIGLLDYEFEGTVITDAGDLAAQTCDLTVHLAAETCDWLTEPVVQWFEQTVSSAVKIEFDRYIQSGDLSRTVKRLESLEAKLDEQEGYVGMFL